jgi:hypothetical protein
MRFRKLRIAWSVMCAVACVLLIVLWVRSANHRMDVITGKTLANRGFLVASVYGEVEIDWIDRVRSPNLAWDRQSMVMNVLKEPRYFPFENAGFKWIAIPDGVGLSVPHWFLVLISACLGVVPCLRWRFSLRTLLTATLLIAVVLGLIVYVTQQ